mmetsp:Transcript_14286/g.17997  ORF Transcript_14286/g.17997 Transcript_14286/m.17997 type:complete len:159 (-) Transcript_14286:632-1108(-)|eukprot:CAMPEP_0170453600 /NCGR_PEP_ID=MMETSP0123-20130129/2129_1 /TAXON_ID=182087 /ORGANISM="Favella ehrenbergii, Strain Fehren 1" /LENGTH=158 /DNA_ID=CAMNT_0010716029 /DNA_START=926 /DNA_END=1402 /DNA_ORIENTATION=-
MYRVDRDVYSILDWVGDVGGLNEGVQIILGAVLVFMQYNELEHLLIERLYRSDSEYSAGEGSKGEQLQDSKTSWLRQSLNDSCCLSWLMCCKPCRLSRQERLFKKARDHLGEELDIVNFLKKIRRFEAVEKFMKKHIEMDIDPEQNEEYVIVTQEILS